MAKQELGISDPGKCRQLISPSEALRRNPNFFEGRPTDVSWTLTVRHLDGRIEKLPAGTDWEAVSRFGVIRSAVVTNPDGSPAFDRPRYDEAPNVNIVAWGKDKKGKVKVALISQSRPHADNEFEPENTEPMIFEQIPMGFVDKVIGKDQMERFEHAHEAATRETQEETGAIAVLDIACPEYSKHYPNPTFIGTNSDLVFVEVDLTQIDKMKMDRTEPIFNADYVPVSEVLADIKKGKTDRGYARMCTANSAILIFLAGLEQFHRAERNHTVVSRKIETYKKVKTNLSDEERRKLFKLKSEIRELEKKATKK